jgi:hypothetical protein
LLGVEALGNVDEALGFKAATLGNDSVVEGER